MGRERRKAERHDAKLFIELESLPVGRGVVIDLSTLGFAVETEANLEPGTEYTCHLEVPITLQAKVVRRLAQGQVKKYGFQFVRQGFLDRLVLRKIIRGPRRTRRL